MRKLLCICMALTIMLTGISVSAEDFFADIYSVASYGADETVLMEIDESVKEAFEERLVSAWDNMDTEVKLYPDVKIHKDDISGCFSTVCYENPKYYYVEKKFSITANKEGYVGSILNLSYTVDNMDEIRKVWTEIDKATEDILFFIDPEMTDFEKVMTVHDYMDAHYEYDITDPDQTYLIMLDKKGVCTAYAEAFQHMMNVLGIESTLVASKQMGHIWNMIKLDGEWYHADITWDDPTPDQFAHVCHMYMLLSEDAIKALGHEGFDSPYKADSNCYDNAPWRDDESAIVTVGGVMYYVDNNNLIDENGDIIYESLDGGDGRWSVSKKSYVTGVVWAGLCEINGKLYFNTDEAIYSYDPSEKETVCVLEEYGIGGLYADKNTIYYNCFDFDKQQFVKKGELRIDGTFVKAVTYEDGKAVVRLYNDYDEPLWVISSGDTYLIEKVEAKSTGIVRCENGEEQKIFIWNDALQPVFESFTISE